jgi:type 1 glutamine amidotransferase
MRVITFAALLFLLGSFSTLIEEEKGDANWKKIKVLIYTKNGEGYVHDNIPFAVASIQKLGKQYGFATDVSDNANVFTEQNLRQYSLLIFTSTNNDVFDTDQQRLAFRHYIEAGGGFVGIHSAIGTERNWTWFKMMLGGSFVWHPKFQKYIIRVVDSSHPSVSEFPKEWVRQDECYFMKEIYPGIRPVMAHDLSSLDASDKEKIKESAGNFGRYYPAVWYHQFDGGPVWITALGHDKNDYEDPVFIKHIYQGIKFVAGELKEKDFAKAYAKDRDDALK